MLAERTRASGLAAARRDAVQADAEAAGPQGRPEPPARRAGRDNPARPDRGIQTRPGAQPGHVPCRHQPDAAHQGDRQSDPDRTDRNCAIARRGLDRLRSDDLATAGNGGFLPPPRRARGSQSSGVRARHSRRLAAGARRRISTFPLSAPCRRITGSGLRCWRPSPSATISNCSASRPQALPASSPLHRCFQGEVWGADMYQALRRSSITLNSHIDMAGREAGNMRLFEATGVGAFLLTDFKDNLHTLVRAGSRSRGVALHRRLSCRHRPRDSATPMAALRSRAPARRERMAQHTYRHRAAEILGFVEDLAGAAMKLPRIVRQIGKRVVKATPILRRHILTSTDYRVLSGIDEARDAAASSAGWLAARTVTRQERAYQGLIAAMKRGDPRLDFRSRRRPWRPPALPPRACSRSAAAAAIIRKCSPRCSPAACAIPASTIPDAMIARARARYPSTAFEVADATRLPYPDDAFDIVFNGVSLMHIIDYQAAIREAARVASTLLHPPYRAGVRATANHVPAKIRLWRAGRRDRFQQERTDVAVPRRGASPRARMALHPLRRIRGNGPSLLDRDLPVRQGLIGHTRPYSQNIENNPMHSSAALQRRDDRPDEGAQHIVDQGKFLDLAEAGPAEHRHVAFDHALVVDETR